MKKVLYAVLLLNFLLLSIETFGQDEEEIIDTRIKKDHSNTEWFTEMNAARPNYWKVKSSYDAFFTAHPNERSTEQKLCRRWMQMNASNIDARGYLLPGPTTELLKASFKAAARSTTKVSTNNILSTTASTFAGEQLGSWRMIGPFHAYKSKCSGTSSSLSGGYTDRVYINPYNTNNMYAGTSYGGLWVSQDAGNSWRLSDAEFPNATNTYANRDYYYGDIEAVKQNPQLVYAATEAGVLKSTNAGSSWNYCNELNRTVDPTLRPYFLAVAHDDAQTVLASFGRKIFRSTDAGATWTMVFDNSAGGANKKFANVHSAQPFGISERTYNFFGLDFHPADANIVYIGMWNAANEPCIYKSTDRGATFSFLLNILQSTGRTAAYGTQGLEMLVVPAAPDKIFTRPYFSQDSIYHFGVNGAVLNRIKPGAPMEGFTINLRNENIVYTGYYGPSPNGSIVKKSTNAGLTFTDMTNGYGGCPKYVHPDIRGYAAVGDTVLVAHDGGLSRSFNGMTSIETIGYDISAVDLWGFSSSFKSDITVAGCDHGPTKVRRFNGDQGWRDIGGGDAGDCTVNPANDSLFYYNYNSSSTAAGKFIGVLNADNTISTTSMVNNDADLNLMEVDPNLYTKVYNLKGTTVKVSVENGNNPVVFKDFGVNVTRFRIARKNARVMYVLLQNSIVQKSIDSGATWVNITPTTTQSNGRTVINDIEVGAQPDDVWLLYGQTQTDCKLLSTTDAGANWSNLTGILPAAAAKQFVYQRGTNAGLYVYLEGTAGVWYRSNNLSNWQQVGNGLPMMGYARNLYTVPAKNKFRMGSSRGAWEHELIETSGLDAQIAFDRSVCDRWSNIVKFRDFSAFNGAVTFEWSFPGGMPSTSTEEYPRVMYANPGVYSVTLTVRDAIGNSSTQTLNNAITVINEGEAGLQPIADAYAWDAASSTNYGTVSPLVMKKDIGGTNRIPYFKFDLNNITEPVHSVRLQLFIQSASSATGTAPQWQLWKCTNDGWSETGITWSNRPSTSTLLATTTAKSSGMVEWDNTSAVNTELAGDKILSLAVLPATNSTWYLNFHSRETATTLLRPQLMINQYPAITLTQPANGDGFDIGSSTTVKANVIDSISTPVVQFLINGNEAATIAQPPYEWNFNNMQPGSYGIRLRAENNAGFVAFSDSITVRVKDTSGMLEPIADSYVRDGSNATVNFGTQNVLVVKKDGSGFNRVTYLKFDLSGYTQVDTAKLKLTIQSGNTNAGVTQWQLWKCDNDNWTETGLNWNNKPVTTTLLGTVPGKRTGVAEWNISNAVQTEANGDKVLTLAVVSTVVNGTSDVNFHSREVTDATVRPKLIIEAPPVVTLLQPANSDTLIEKSTILIKAKATDDKKVANVSFFINGEQKAVIAQAPYEWGWTNTAPGNYGIRAKATDNSGISAWSDSVTVYVKDTTAPVITCPANIVAVYDPAVCGAMINYNITATDNFSTPVLTITNGLASGSVFPLGTTTVTAVATDTAGNTATCWFTITVNAVTTTSSLNISTTNVQYSDKPVFTARITNGGSNCGRSAAATATFKLGTEVLATIPMQVNGNDLIAVYNDKTFTDAPVANKTVSVEFNTINEAFVVTNPSAISFSIVKEDAAAHYSGALFVSTAAANNGSATINLKATIRDITAETGSALYDAFEGDIRNATATFINRDNNTVIAANVPLVLATPGDTKTAIASYNWNLDIGSANSQSYTIGVIVNNFYTRNSSSDNAIITVSKPLDDFIAGGGNLLLANSSGIKAGDEGTLNDLGFSLKWNKSKSNLQGYLNTIIRRMENGVLHVYQVKANSMTSMVVDGSINSTHPYPTASFGAKANIQDITDPLNPVAVDGNATLQVSMTDGSNYNAADKIGITVWNKNGSMWYSSNWTGVTAEQTLSAGDIVINSAAANNRVVMTINDAAITNADNKLSVHAYPNPSGYEFKLDVQTNGEERIEVKVMDLHGRVVKVMQVSSGQSIQFGSTLKAGIYFVEVIQGKQKERIKLIKL